MQPIILFLCIIYCIYSNVGYQYWHADFNNGDNGWTTSGIETAWRTDSSTCPTDWSNCCCVHIDPTGHYISAVTATKGYKNITLSFDFHGQQSVTNNGVYCRVYYSLNNGQNFYPLWQYGGPLLLIKNVTLPLPKYASNSENVMIGLFNDATLQPQYNYCFFDNVILTGVEPTTNPTTAPTNNPTNTPTYIPTRTPLKTSIQMPTYNPSITPSKIPSKTPTNNPTNTQTNSPTNDPSKFPSKFPSKVPFKFPSEVPSKIPSKVPSKLPSKFPSKTPSKVPSKVPSTYTTTETDIFVIIVAVDDSDKLDTDEITNIVINILTIHANNSNIDIDIISSDINKHSISILFTVSTNSLDTDIIERKVEHKLEDEYGNDIDFDVSVGARDATTDIPDELHETGVTYNHRITDMMLKVVVIVMVALCIICGILIFIAKKQIDKHEKDNVITNNVKKCKKKNGVSNTINLESNSQIEFIETTRICNQKTQSSDMNEIILNTIESNINEFTICNDETTNQTITNDSDSDNSSDSFCITQGKTAK